MNARRDSTDGPEAGSFGGRVLLAGAVVFAAAATGLLVLTDEQKWLRLGIVAALWAALTGAFLAARYRRQLTDQREVAAERQEIYELELEREIAARREFELEAEAKARREAEKASRDDIAALRDELQNLRQTLEGLLGGEFLVERYALRAESTRMRSLGEDRSLSVRHDVKHLPAAQAQNSAPFVVPQVVREAETELIERIRDAQQKQRRPEPRVADSRPPSVPRSPERPARPEPVKPAPQPHPAEVSDRWFVPEGLVEVTPPPPSRSEQPRRPEPQRPADPPPARRATPNWNDDGEQEWGPSWEKQRPPSPAARPPEPVRQPELAQAHETGVAFGGKAEQTSWLAQYNKSADAAAAYGTRAYVPQQEPETNGVEEPAGRRHRPEQEEDGGGRRRRAEGQPSWQETVGRRAEDSSGSHASGRSVSELLATHGREPSPRRRRRRED